MANQSILHTKRQTSRAKATAARALGSEGEQWLALQYVAPDFVASAELFERADAKVRQLEAEVREKSVAGSLALVPLSRLYDEVRHVVSARFGSIHPGASTFTTPDDLINAARDLAEELVSCSTQAGIGPLLGALGKATEEAATAQGASAVARKALQKAQHDREAAASQLRPHFVCFRRLVRCAFGKQSREYRELLDRRHRARWPESEEPDVGAVGRSGSNEERPNDDARGEGAGSPRAPDESNDARREGSEEGAGSSRAIEVGAAVLEEASEEGAGSPRALDGSDDARGEASEEGAGSSRALDGSDDARGEGAGSPRALHRDGAPFGVRR